MIIECLQKAFNAHKQIEKYLEDIEILKLRETNYQNLIKDIVGDEVYSNTLNLNNEEAALYLKSILN